MFELPPHVRRVVARGQEYFYFQRGRGTPFKGMRTPLPRDLHSVEFWRTYREALGAEAEPTGKRFNDLITA
jgi:hypothetical protein